MARLAVDHRHHKPRNSRRGSSARALIAVTLLLATASAALAFRRDVVAAAPTLAPVYAAIGLPSSTLPLRFEGVESFVRTTAGERTLFVEGTIRHLTFEPVRVPNLKIVVRDSSQRELHSWSTSPPKPELKGGESVMFRARLPSPPDHGFSVKIELAAPDRPGRA